MKRMLSSNMIQAAAGTLAVGATVAVAAFSAGPAIASTHHATAHPASGTPLTVESSPVGEANGFNPFVPTSAAEIVGAT
jgi:hypothetical protein